MLISCPRHAHFVCRHVKQSKYHSRAGSICYQKSQSNVRGHQQNYTLKNTANIHQMIILSQALYFSHMLQLYPLSKDVTTIQCLKQNVEIIAERGSTVLIKCSVSEQSRLVWGLGKRQVPGSCVCGSRGLRDELVFGPGNGVIQVRRLLVG